MSFIALGQMPLIVAGGGGGAYWQVGSVGGDGWIGPGDGLGGVGPGAGAGWFTDGNNGSGPDVYYGAGGHSWPTYQGGAPNDPGDAGLNGISVGGYGGFGGGGGGGYSCGGGGGGYSGGPSCGGGGGSFISPRAVNVVALDGANKGPISYYFDNPDFPVGDSVPGYINLALSAVPEPSSWLLLILGFGGIGLMLRKFRRPKLLY